MKADLRQQFEAIYDDLVEPIFRHCYFRISVRERAKEITQEVFMKTWQYMMEGNTIENYKAFIYRVANNLVINELERRHRTSSLEEMHEDTGFDPPADEDQEVIQIRLESEMVLKKMELLEARDRDLLLMRYIDELPVKEIAQLLEEEENTISVRIHRAVKKLKEIYEYGRKP
jgi:RNA polymerase sigma factor (sigma-70 family)